MYKVKYSQKSQDNLVDIFSYISEDDFDNAAKVLYSIKQTVEIVKLFPYAGKQIDENYRQIVETKYKYRIVYKIRGKEVYISTIFKYQNIF